MADNEIRYGFRWMKGFGSRTDLQPFRAFVATAYQAAPGSVNVDLNVGDPVKRVSDGSVALAVAGDTAYGVITSIGPYYDSSLGAMKFGSSLPGATAWTGVDRQSVVYVVPVLGQVFEIDCDDNTTATTQAAYQAFFGENCDISINAVAPRAHPRLDISLHATTNTLVWRILELSPRVNQDFTGNYVKMLVTANLAQQPPSTILGV